MDVKLLPINEEVTVNSFYFTNTTNKLRSFPKTIEYGGLNYTFRQNGLRYLIQKGENLIELFDMSDGETVYRLRKEKNNWTLINIKPKKVTF